MAFPMISSEYHMMIMSMFLLFVMILMISVPVEGSMSSSTRKKQAAAVSINYKDALTKSIMFFEGQRSGKLPYNQRIKWRGDSGITDGQQHNMDLSGGYYDAGDNVKFNFPMAFTTSMLSWGAIEYEKHLRQAGEMENTMVAIRWATDYLLKCSSKVDQKDKILFVGVGDPNTDHICWERPEDMDTDRKVVSVTVGSDVAAEMAAALAAASIVFRISDPNYSNKLLETAQVVMQFATAHLGAYSDQLKGLVCPFYCSYSGYNDELLWGAAWLYKATKNASYLTCIKSSGANHDVNIISWDNKFGASYVLLSTQYMRASYKKKKKGSMINSDDIDDLQPFKEAAEKFMCKLMPIDKGGSTQSTRGGLLYFLEESNLQYVTAATFVLTTYARYHKLYKHFQCGNNMMITPSTLQRLAKKQVKYILGKNPMNMSYMVGYSKNYPKLIHHRGSSLPSIKDHKAKIGCNISAQYYKCSPRPNPNILTGAIVGGPDNNDTFHDNRDFYKETEPATYINAAFVGPLAYFTAAAAATKN